MHHLEECGIVVALNFVEIPFVGIFTRTFEKAFGRSLYSGIGEEGSLNRRLCQSYSAEIRGHKGRP